MKKNRTLLILVLAAVLILVILYFAVVRPVVNRPEDTTAVTTGDGEGLQYDAPLLYPSLKRADIFAIHVYNETGEYKFERTGTEVAPTVTNTSSFHIYQKKGDIYEHYATMAYNEERFSELVVSVGTFYYLRNVTSEGAAVGETLNYADYGLAPEQDPAYFEIEPFEGDPVRVYVGSAAVTEAGYYVRVEGRDAVYVSNSTLVAETALAPLTAFVDATLTTYYDAYGYNFIRDFTFWQSAAEDAVITGEERVKLVYTIFVDGKSKARVTETVDLRREHESFAAALSGYPVGNIIDGTEPRITLTYTADDVKDERYHKTSLCYRDAREFAGQTVTYRIESVEKIYPLFIELDFLNKSERNSFYSGVVYKIDGPESKLAYVPSSNNYMSALEKLGALVGSETVAVGLDEETIEKYGLDAYTIYYDMPNGMTLDSDNLDPAKREDYKVKSWQNNFLYISERQEDGSYYVGSAMMNIVARVDGESLFFLERSNSWWMKNEMFSVNINTVDRIDFDFDYTDLDKTFSFDIRHALTAEGRVAVTSIVHLGDNKEITVNDFKSFYLHLATVYYEGEYEGELPVEEILLGESTLTMTVTLNADSNATGGTTCTYRFYPYSERRVLVSVQMDGGDAGAYFYVTTSDVEKIYRDISLLLAGKTPDPDKQY